MARCPDCNKFVGNEENEPEVNNVDVESIDEKKDEDTTTTLTAEVRIVNACADCGSELSEYTFDMEDETVLIPAEHTGPGHELSAEEDGFIRTSRTEGKSRGMKTFYGAEGTVKVVCSCNDEILAQVTLKDDIQASGMESLN